MNSKIENIPFMKRRQHVVLLMVLALALLTGGCWGRVPIDELIIVLSVGIDVGSTPGTYAVTIEGVIPSEQSDEDSGGLPSRSTLITGEGPTLLGAMQSIQRRTSKQVFLGHLRVAIFGQELVRQGISSILDHLERSGDLRRTVTILIAEKTAREALETEPPFLQLRGLAFDSLAHQIVTTGQYNIIFGDFLEHISTPGTAAVAPVINETAEGTGITVTGMGAFHGDKLVGIFDIEQSLGLSLVLARAQQSSIISCVQCGDGNDILSNTFALRTLSSSVKPRIRNGALEAIITVNATSRLTEHLADNVQLSTTEGWETIERNHEHAIRQAIQSMLDQAQAWKTDVILLGEAIHRKYPHLWRDIQADWPEHFAHVRFHVEVEGKINEIGLVRDALPVPKADDVQ